MYSYENYYKVKGELERRRTAALAATEARNEELRERCPEIKKIDEELAGTGLLIFRTACNGGDLAPIRARNENLQKRRKELVISLGLPEDYSEVRYSCKKCSDSGYVDTKMCSCLREELIKETIASSGIGNLIEKQSFENFNLDFYKYDPAVYERMKYNFDNAKKYAESFISGKKKMLLLLGSTGSGKTHLSTSIAREVIKGGFDVVYDTVQNIFADFEADKFRSGWSSDAKPKSDKYLECDLLIIDDLGTEFSTAFTVSCLFNIVTTRQNRGLGTIISSNLDASELNSKYEARIFSRIVGGGANILHFNTKDYRLSGKMK